MWFKKSLDKRILLAFSLLFFVVICFVALVLYSYVRSSTRQRNQTYLNNHSALVAQQVDAVFDNANQISVRTFFSRDIMDSLSRSLKQGGEDNYFDAHEMAERAVFSNLFIIAGMDMTEYIINLYNESAFFSNKYYEVSWPRVRESMKDGHLRDAAGALEGSTTYITALDAPYWTDQDVGKWAYLSFSRQYRNYTTHKSSGVVEVLIPADVFEEILRAETGDLSVFLCDARGNVICAASAPDERQSAFLKQCFEGGAVQEGARSSDAAGMDGYLKSVGDYDLYVMAMQRRDVNEYLSYFMGILLGALLLYALSLGTYILIVRRMTQPLNDIVATLRGASWNQLKMSLDFHGKESSDLDVLTDAYSAMYEKIRESVNLLVTSRLNEQKAIYLALQSQISPHFIYNTIANISACAYESGVYKIVDICDKLSGLLRYATDYTSEFSDVENELEYTRNYLELMKLRYEDDFCYDVSCDSSCAGIRIPRLVIQTVIENCFKHAFPKVSAPWYLSVECYREDGWWLIDIRHNGVPISDEVLQPIIAESERVYRDIAKGLDSHGPGGLGLLNSITRLRMYCNNRFRFESLSDEGGLSVIRFGGAL